MEYYSAPKKKALVPRATTWMGLQGVMLSELSQAKANAIRFYLHVDSKEQNKQNKIG